MLKSVFKDLSGKKFGRLSILKRLPNFKGKVMWQCLCDCGAITSVRSDSLLHKKQSSTRSCGCLQKEAASKNGKRRLLPNNLKLKKDIFYSYKKRAKKENKKFSLNFEQFVYFLEQSCVYCGRIGINIIKHRNGSKLAYNGIDRLDSKKGYNTNNVQTCCGQCNYMKLDYTEKEFLEQIERVYNYRVKKDV